ncbi:CWC16 protein [Paraphoma chrysanthemicola]|uniref:CWC16 protein n=1 Tax=Paraphoma chrysanthemicola TaxID=798071 RepID=A0A8K0VSA9_9PLEO|nr:CWC16 protein [Paraphoma chrysanthemicola]
MQGFNMGRYYPPDAINAPSFNTSHPLGKRASKSSQGIITVRFELPFAVWCDHCNPTAIVGQGVRFNAEKKKVGNYYSTPIWSFRMKHSACGGWWEIRTDPKNANYVVVEGAKKRDYGPQDKQVEGDGDFRFLTDEERERRRVDAFAELEGRSDEKIVLDKSRERLEELYDKSATWKDPYEVNARLRRGFRVDRKKYKQMERQKTSIQDKYSVSMEIVEEVEADRMRANMVEFGELATTNASTKPSTWRPLFESPNMENIAESASDLKRHGGSAGFNRHVLQRSLITQSKAAIDPFLQDNRHPRPRPTFATIKKRQTGQFDTERTAPTSITQTVTTEQQKSPTTVHHPSLDSVLVAYDSE